MKQIRIAGNDIVEHWIEWVVEYPDGEVCFVEDEETADSIIKCAKVVKAKYKKKYREVFVTDWVDPE